MKICFDNHLYQLLKNLDYKRAKQTWKNSLKRLCGLLIKFEKSYKKVDQNFQIW